MDCLAWFGCKFLASHWFFFSYLSCVTCNFWKTFENMKGESFHNIKISHLYLLSENDILTAIHLILELEKWHVTATAIVPL